MILIKILVGMFIWYHLCNIGIDPIISLLIVVIGIWKWWPKKKEEKDVVEEV